MKQDLSAEQVQRIAEMFERNLGRELTPIERRYLGLSVAMVAVDDIELNHEIQSEQGWFSRG